MVVDGILYFQDEDGVIHQYGAAKYTYDVSYISQYDTLGELAVRMSYLRLGYILGKLPTVPKSLLDIGYGNGAFLKVAKDVIPHCYGNDIAGSIPPDGCAVVHDITQGCYDVITFFDSLEHFENLDFVKKLQCKYIVISVPECHCPTDWWFADWKHRKPHEHLHHFNSMSLVKYMNRMGYQVIALSNVEDAIRKPTSSYSNILTGIFEKI